MEKQVKLQYRLFEPIRRVQFQKAERMSASLSEQYDLIDALKSRQRSQAASVARHHVAAQGQGFSPRRRFSTAILSADGPLIAVP